MLFKIDENNKKLSKYQSNWHPKELEIENFLINSETGILEEYVFGGEQFFLVSNQVRTRANKRADILALDQFGNGVIIELKRDECFLGVETQALQYLADFSKFKGKNFIREFSKGKEKFEENILSFLGGNAIIDDINKNSRIILIARSFDPTLYSMGEWLASKGIPFRCITYSPIEIEVDKEKQKLISFSIAFDRSNDSFFSVSPRSIVREPGIFWHNIAANENDWWNFLKSKGQIPACFESKQGDKGERILTSYINGDKIVAYATGYGAIGWGEIEDSSTYRLLDENHADAVRGRDCLHRLDIKWRATASELSECLKPDYIRNNFGIYHPLSTSVSINKSNGLKLIEELNQHFKK